MTYAEIGRWLQGATWRMQQQATFDYILGHLIGVSCSRMISSDVSYPRIEEAYPDLFEVEKEEPIVKEDDIMTISQNRFLAFAQAHNARMQKGVED